MYIECPPEIGKKVGIHFYRNILSEINLALKMYPFFDGFQSNSLTSYIKKFLEDIHFDAKIY